MSGLNNTVRRLANVSRGKGYMTSGERKRKEAAAVQTKKDKMFAGATMPDEEEIARNERRKAAKRRGSRVSTVMTDDDTLG